MFDYVLQCIVTILVIQVTLTIRTLARGHDSEQSISPYVNFRLDTRFFTIYSSDFSILNQRAKLRSLSTPKSVNKVDEKRSYKIWSLPLTLNNNSFLPKCENGALGAILESLDVNFDEAVKTLKHSVLFSNLFPSASHEVSRRHSGTFPDEDQENDKAPPINQNLKCGFKGCDGAHPPFADINTNKNSNSSIKTDDIEIISDQNRKGETPLNPDLKCGLKGCDGAHPPFADPNANKSSNSSIKTDDIEIISDQNRKGETPLNPDLKCGLKGCDGAHAPFADINTNKNSNSSIKTDDIEIISDQRQKREIPVNPDLKCGFKGCDGADPPFVELNENENNEARHGSAVDLSYFSHECDSALCKTRKKNADDSKETNIRNPMEENHRIFSKFDSFLSNSEITRVTAEEFTYSMLTFFLLFVDPAVNPQYSELKVSKLDSNETDTGLPSAQGIKKRSLLPSNDDPSPSLKKDNESLEMSSKRSSFEMLLLHILSPTFLRLFSRLFTTLTSKKGRLGLNFFQPTYVNFIDAVCEASEFSVKNESNPELHMCALINGIKNGLSCLGTDKFDDAHCGRTPPSLREVTCLPPYGAYKGQNFLLASLTPSLIFKDIRAGTPPMLPITLDEAVVNAEGMDYYYLWNGIDGFLQYASTTYPCGDSYSPSFIPGWTLSDVITYYSEELIQTYTTPRQLNDVPVIAILRREESVNTSCKTVVLIRGTINKLEWNINARFELVDFLTPNVKVHAGIYSLASVLFDGLVNALKHELKTPKCELIFSGHSLGGALSHVLSLMVAYQFPTTLVSSINFGSPQVLNQEGVILFRKLVNGRNLTVDLDGITRMPCPVEKYPSGLYLCKDGENGPLELSRFQKYGQNPAVFTWTAKDHAVYFQNLYPLVAIALGVDITIPLSLQIFAAHTCVYNCILSKFCNKLKATNCSRCYAFVEYS